MVKLIKTRILFSNQKASIVSLDQSYTSWLSVICLLSIVSRFLPSTPRLLTKIHHQRNFGYLFLVVLLDRRGRPLFLAFSFSFQLDRSLKVRFQSHRYSSFSFRLDRPTGTHRTEDSLCRVSLSVFLDWTLDLRRSALSFQPFRFSCRLDHRSISIRSELWVFFFVF